MSQNINIQTVGKGPHLALLHGWGMNSTVWSHLVKPLSKHFTLHLIDLPGMGNSPPVTPYDLLTVSEVVAEHLPNSCTVIGWSLGGLVAMQMAISQPVVVEKLVLIGSTPCFVNHTALSTRAHWRAGVEQTVFEEFAENVAQSYQKSMLNFLTLQCLGSKDANKLLRALRAEFLVQPEPSMQTLQAGLQILQETDLRTQINHINQQTMIVHGDKDRLAPLQAGNWLAQTLPNASIRVINGAAHAPFLSHQDTFEKVLFEFLGIKGSRWKTFFK